LMACSLIQRSLRIDMRLLLRTVCCPVKFSFGRQLETSS
jgi:hypothetical protein